jgi:hypothetical protein
MRRMLLNLSAVSVIALAGFAMASPVSASQSEPVNSCKAGNGATCSGAHCCADATNCWADCS